MNVTEKFQQFESSSDLNKFTIDGFWYYPLVKMVLYFELTGQKGISNVENDRRSTGVRQILRQFILGIKWKFKSGQLHSVKYLFVDNARTRRKAQADRYENIYIEPIMNAFNKDDQLLFEYPTPDFAHYPDSDTIDLYFPDWDIFKVFLSAKLKKKKWISAEAHLTTLYELFEITFDADFLNDRLTKTFLFIKYFKRILKKVQPKIIILVDGYGYKQMALIYAAKELRIPTVELQHGLINMSHMAYMYSQVANRQLFADYLFTFGFYFNDLVKKYSVLWENDQLIPVGFPYIELAKDRPIKLPERLQKLAASYRIIYITSQWTVGNELRDFILQLSAKLDNDYRIFYKIHPGEKNASEFYESFKSIKNIELISDKTVSSLEIMKVAAIHSTVYSTSYFESVFFELPNIFIKVPEYSKNMEIFINDETTFMANNVDTYLACLDKIKNDPNLEKKLTKRRTTYYQPDALSNVLNALEGILVTSES